MSILNWAKFFAYLLPVLTQVARDLFVRHGGNVQAATIELRRIQDYGSMRREKQAAIDRELADLRALQERKDKAP